MKNKTTFSKSILGVALGTILILVVPAVAMQFTDEVNWSVIDFITMGALIFGTGTSFVVVLRYATNNIYKVAMVGAFGTTFLMIWANLAVGLIGSGPHWGNMMYMVVFAVVIIGSTRSRFSERGMERVMYGSAITLVLIAIIALVANMDASSGSSVNEIIAVNGFFATLYVISGALFRLAALENSAEKSTV